MTGRETEDLHPIAVLDRRLLQVAPHLLARVHVAPIADAAGDLPEGEVSARLLPHLVRAVRSAPDLAGLWLTLTALAGAWPTDDEVRDTRRYIDLADDTTAALHLLETALEESVRTTGWLELELVTGAVLVDVNFCARFDVHTGIQRVVRETVPRWSAVHDFTPVAWTDDYTALRALRKSELDNVFAYRAHVERDLRPTTDAEEVDHLVVPWRSRLLLPEIHEPEAGPFLSAFAQHSGNSLSAVGYDMIPIVSADLRPGPEATRFTRYLDVIKHADRVAGISSSSVAEFAGFSSALAAQGLTGPSVVEVVLPSAVPDAAAAAGPEPRPGRPEVLLIGTHEPHKNHRTVVHAAERLWREGLDFELSFIGGRGWRALAEGMCYDDALAAGRPIRDHGKVSDADLSRAMRDASFTVFLSLHEGYGLPVAESLAAGTPVLTSDFGSLAELAAGGGGCVTVDPRDDDAVAEAMRRLLTDPEVLTRLRDEIAERPVRTWDTYAEELWHVLVTEDGQ